MKKSIIAIIILVLVSPLVYFFVTKQTPAPLQEQTQEEQVVQESEEVSSKKFSMSEMIARGGAHQCDVEQKIDSVYVASSKGKVYMADGKVRGDFDTQVQGITMKNSLIVRDGYTYTWSSLSKDGYKIKENSGAVDTSGPAGTAGQFNFNDEAIGAYECTTWAKDESKFTLPAGITFKEV